MDDIVFSRKNILCEELVIVDGQPGCGKTLFTSIIASMHRVELLQYSAFLENICKVFYEGQISRDATLTMLQLKFDRMLYEAR